MQTETGEGCGFPRDVGMRGGDSNDGDSDSYGDGDRGGGDNVVAALFQALLPYLCPYCTERSHDLPRLVAETRFDPRWTGSATHD